MLLSTQTKSFLYSLTAVLFWSTVATAFKLTLEKMNFVQLLFYSSLTSSIVLFIFASFNSPKELKELFLGRNLSRNLLLGFINPFLYYFVLFQAYSLLPAQEAQPLNYTWPITVSIFASIFLGQKLTSKIIFGLIVSFFGVIIIATHGDLSGLRFHNLFGTILAVGSSIIWATFWTIKLLDKRDDSVKLFGAFLFGTIITGVYIFFFDSFALSDYKYLLGAVYIGLFEMGVTFFLWMKGLQLSENKAKTSTLAYLSPFVSLIFIAFLLGESIYYSSIIGLSFIIGGILLQRIKYGKSSKIK